MIELLILYVLSSLELTMYAIHKRIGDYFGCFSTPSFGAIKPALVRLEKNQCLRLRKDMSEGGRLSVFYSITPEGKEELKRLIMAEVSSNPLQFSSNCAIKISCASQLNKDERKLLFKTLMQKALNHKFCAENILNNENGLTFYQRIILDNSILEYKNFISLLENLEKENERL